MSDEDEPIQPEDLPERQDRRRRGDLVMDEMFERSFQSEVDALPPMDRLSGLDARRALVVKMVAAGMSMSQAAELCGVSKMVAYKACAAVKKGRTIGDPSGPLRIKQDMLTDMALDGAILANAKMLEMMENDEMRPSEMVKAYQSLQNTVMKRFNWGDQSPLADDKTKNALANALDALRGGAEVSIKAPDEAEQAKVIEAEIVEDEK